MIGRGKEAKVAAPVIVTRTTVAVIITTAVVTTLITLSSTTAGTRPLVITIEAIRNKATPAAVTPNHRATDQTLHATATAAVSEHIMS